MSQPPEQTGTAVQDEVAAARAAEEDAYRQLATLKAQVFELENERADMDARLVAAREATAAELTKAEQTRKDLETRLTAQLSQSGAERASLELRYQERLADIAQLGQALGLKDKEIKRIKAQNDHAVLRRHIQDLLADSHAQLHKALARPRPSPARRRVERRIAQEIGMIEACGLFDAEWYLEFYADVAESGADPVRHFAIHGAYELRDPGPGFSAFKYHKAYPDVTSAGIPALLHYLRNGQEEGRRVFPVGEGD